MSHVCYRAECVIGETDVVRAELDDALYNLKDWMKPEKVSSLYLSLGIELFGFVSYNSNDFFMNGTVFKEQLCVSLLTGDHAFGTATWLGGNYSRTSRCCSGKLPCWKRDKQGLGSKELITHYLLLQRRLLVLGIFRFSCLYAH